MECFKLERKKDYIKIFYLCCKNKKDYYNGDTDYFKSNIINNNYTNIKEEIKKCFCLYCDDEAIEIIE